MAYTVYTFVYITESAKPITSSSSVAGTVASVSGGSSNSILESQLKEISRNPITASSANNQVIIIIILLSVCPHVSDFILYNYSLQHRLYFTCVALYSDRQNFLDVLLLLLCSYCTFPSG